MKNIKKDNIIRFDDAYQTAMSFAHRLGIERVSIDRALNRVLAEDVFSDMDMPPFNKSAMDGFACRRADLASELTVIETIPAGSTPERVIGPNQCAKIMTGAVVPEGADCVIRVEYTESTDDKRIKFTGEQTEDNIRLKGEDIKKGAVVLRAGRIIKAPQIALLASQGCVSPLVALQPKVGIIATGNELVEPSRKPSASQIRNSNAFQLAAQVEGVGAAATHYGIARDTKEAIDAKVKKAISENDVVILSGGTSTGDYDLVPEVLKQNGIQPLFEKVAIKPGKPTLFGVSGEDRPSLVCCFALPGNPISTFVIFELLVKPFIFKMMGHDFEPVIIHRQLEKAIVRKNIESESRLPVVFTDNNKAAIIEYHGSGHINALCEADGLVCVPAGVAEIKAGTTVAVRQI